MESSSSLQQSRVRHFLCVACLLCTPFDARCHRAHTPPASHPPPCAAPLFRLRWQINATPRVGSPGTFDGISVYRLDRRGRVRQHEITDVQMRDPVSGGWRGWLGRGVWGGAGVVACGCNQLRRAARRLTLLRARVAPCCCLLRAAHHQPPALRPQLPALAPSPDPASPLPRQVLGAGGCAVCV